jgi:hypothetical protein
MAARCCTAPSVSEHMRREMRQAKCDLTHAIFDVKHATCVTQHATYSVQSKRACLCKPEYAPVADPGLI